MKVSDENQPETITGCFELEQIFSAKPKPQTMMSLTCSLDATTLASPSVPDRVLAPFPVRFEKVRLKVGAAGLSEVGWSAPCLAVSPYNAIALFTIVVIRLISRYDARNTTGCDVISILVICWEAEVLLSKERVRSTSSRKRTVSASLPMLVNDMPSRSILNASIP